MLVALVALTPFALATPIFIQDVSIVIPGKAEAVVHQSVLIDGDKIVSVEPANQVKAPANARVVDGKGKFLLPGLWDMHVHLVEPKSLSLFTANGVTGIRTMFGAPSHLTWRKQIGSGELIGPRMVIGSPIVDGPKPIWPGSIGVLSADQARAAVRKVKADGYDFVKVYSLLSKEPYLAIADEAKKIGIPFEGHVPHSVGLIEAEKAGQRSSEHLMGLALSSSSKEDEIREKIAAALPEGREKAGQVSSALSKEVTDSFEPKKWDALLKHMARGKMWQCPTLVVLKAVSYLDDPEFRKDDRTKYVSSFIRTMWDPKNDFRLRDRKPEAWAAAKKSYQNNFMLLGQMHKAGVPILAGTDCMNPYVFPGFSLHDELALLVDAGLKPTEALATATINPAKYYGEEGKSGLVAKSHAANLVLLSANPLSNIRNTTKIVTVIQRGRLFDRKELDGILKANEQVGTSQSGSPALPHLCLHD